MNELWKEILPRVQSQRPLIHHWVKTGQQVGYKAGIVIVGFPVSEAHSRESLQRDATRRFLEDLLSEAAGAAMKLDLIVDPNLTVPVVEEQSLFGLGAAVETPAPKPAPVVAAPAPAPAAAAPAPVGAPPAETPASPEIDAFYDDPLIKAALETFKAKVIK